MRGKNLHIQQIESKMQSFITLQKVALPASGWIKALRDSLGITLQQLATKLGVTKQNIRMLEQREKDGSITLKKLKEVAESMDMDLVYGFVPKDGSLENLIDRKARKLASKIVLRTSNSMKLEDQENSSERIQKAIEEKTITLKNELPKMLWD